MKAHINSPSPFMERGSGGEVIQINLPNLSLTIHGEEAGGEVNGKVIKMMEVRNFEELFLFNE